MYLWPQKDVYEAADLVRARAFECFFLPCVHECVHACACAYMQVLVISNEDDVEMKQLTGRRFMAYVVMAYIVMAYMPMAHVVMAYIVMAYLPMAYMVMAYVVTARWLALYGLCSHGLYSYGLHSYGPYTYGLCSYGRRRDEAAQWSLHARARVRMAVF